MVHHGFWPCFVEWHHGFDHGQISPGYRFLDERLSIEYHIDALCSKSMKKLDILGCIRKFISKEISIMLFESRQSPGQNEKYELNVRNSRLWNIS